MNVFMGLKSKLNKMKSFLFDEEDEESEVKKTPKLSFKRENKKDVEIKKQEELSNTQEIEELYFEDVSDAKDSEITEIKSRTHKNEKEFKFPEFDDDDFMVATKKPEPVIKPAKEEIKPLLYQGSKRKEETKRFKPSPIISPIYGLLDEEGNKIKPNTKKNEKNKYDDEITFDDVRKKAYGSLDRKLEDTMKRLSKKTIEEAERDMEKEEMELSREKDKAKKVNVEKPVVISEETKDDDDMILPNVNFKEIDVDKERTKDFKKEVIKEKEFSSDVDDDDDDDTKEQDLFNLIDSMYQKEESEE